MKSLGWTRIAEFVGISAIVASLVFVGLQMRQSQEIAIAETFLSILASEIEVNNAISEYGDLWAKANSGAELDAGEAVIFANLVDSKHWKNRRAFAQLRRLGHTGAADDSSTTLASFLYQNPAARKVWLSQHEMSARHRALFNDFKSPFPLIVIEKLEIMDQAGRATAGMQVAAISSNERESLPKLYVFDCGVIRFDSVEEFSISDDDTDVRALSVPCYVIEHENGRLLWDGGLSSSVADTEGWHGEGMQSRLDRTLAEQLSGIGLDMSSFDYVAFSHMHFDHVGVANELQGGTLIIQHAENEAAFNGGPGADAFDTTLFENLRDVQKIIIDGDHDVFGDGSVQIISAPGHTPGHQVLLLNLANTGPLVLSGDLYHFAVSREKRRPPGFNFDREASLLSMDRIERLIEERGATFWIEHELAQFEKLNKAPAFYD